MFDKNHTIPSPIAQKKYHFEKMEIGDSQEIETPGNYRQTLSRLVSDYGKRYEMKFTIRTASKDSVRVWRIG